jgi:hypothetical protein
MAIHGNPIYKKTNAGDLLLKKLYHIEIKTKQILKLIPENFDREILLGIKETLHN